MSVPPRRPWPARTMILALALTLAGCDQPTGSTRRLKPKPAEPVVEAPAPPSEAPRTPILGRTTQDIRDSAEEKKAGGVVAQSRIVSKDPITLPGNAYVSIIGQAAKGQITHALDLYQAETGEFPKTYDEFMEKIIKPNGVKLPMLPAYQKYTYDAATHQLQITEYPELK